MSIAGKRLDEYIAIFEKVESPLLIIKGNRIKIIWGNLITETDCEITIPNNNTVLIKLEHLNETSPTGSFYDRLYPWLFFRAEEIGIIDPSISRLIECSVGNAGASFAWTASHLGYKDYTVILPEDIYQSRINQVNNLGANLVYSPPFIGPRGYISLLEEILTDDWKINGKPRRGRRSLYPISKIRSVPNTPFVYFIREIISQLKRVNMPTQINNFVFCVGAGNTITQVGKALKGYNKLATVMVCEHKERPFVKYLKMGIEPPQMGIWPEPDWPATTIHGVPLKKLNLDLDVIDDIILLSREERERGWEIANNILGLSAGRPTGLIINSVLKLAEDKENQVIMTIVFDHINKYGDTYHAVNISNLEMNHVIT